MPGFQSWLRGPGWAEIGDFRRYASHGGTHPADGAQNLGRAAVLQVCICWAQRMAAHGSAALPLPLLHFFRSHRAQAGKCSSVVVALTLWPPLLRVFRPHHTELQASTYGPTQPMMSLLLQNFSKWGLIQS